MRTTNIEYQYLIMSSAIFVDNETTITKAIENKFSKPMPVFCFWSIPLCTLRSNRMCRQWGRSDLGNVESSDNSFIAQ